jgi:hypothetical protein
MVKASGSVFEAVRDYVGVELGGPSDDDVNMLKDIDIADTKKKLLKFKIDNDKCIEAMMPLTPALVKERQQRQNETMALLLNEIENHDRVTANWLLRSALRPSSNDDDVQVRNTKLELGLSVTAADYTPWDALDPRHGHTKDNNKNRNTCPPLSDVNPLSHCILQQPAVVMKTLREHSRADIDLVSGEADGRRSRLRNEGPVNMLSRYLMLTAIGLGNETVGVYSLPSMPASQSGHVAMVYHDFRLLKMVAPVRHPKGAKNLDFQCFPIEKKLCPPHIKFYEDFKDIANFSQAYDKFWKALIGREGVACTPPRVSDKWAVVFTESSCLSRLVFFDADGVEERETETELFPLGVIWDRTAPEYDMLLMCHAIGSFGRKESKDPPGCTHYFKGKDIGFNNWDERDSSATAVLLRLRSKDYITELDDWSVKFDIGYVHNKSF